jgi:hypothetical protein
VTVPAPTSAAGYAAWLASIDHRVWGGGDQCASVRLSTGRVLWVFADTTKAGPDGHSLGYFSHSSAWVQHGGDFTMTFPPNGNGILPNEPDGTWYWPSEIVQLPTGTILCSATHVAASGDSYAVIGQRACTLSVDASDHVSFGRWLNYWPSDVSKHWGAGMLVDGTTLRIYATRAGGPYNLHREVWHAAVPTSQIEVSSAWAYSATASIPMGATVGDALSAYRDANGKYHLITKNVFQGSVYDFASPQPHTAFTSAVKISGLDATLEPAAYNPAVHRGLTLASGKQLYTVCHNDSDSDWGNDHYRPTFHEAL